VCIPVNDTGIAAPWTALAVVSIFFVLSAETC
jgi:hypothetical protein